MTKNGYSISRRGLYANVVFAPAVGYFILAFRTTLSMLISIMLMSALAVGGMALTYAFTREKTLLWRLAAGSVVSSAIFGTSVFVLGSIAGFSSVVAAICFVIAVSPASVFISNGYRRELKRDTDRAKGRLNGFSGVKLLRFLYYAFFFTLLWAFFDRVMYEMRDGIYTGGSQNLGDLPYHLGAILSFTEGGNLPPENPSWAGAKFTYPFIADLMTAAFMRLGATLREAMFVQNFVWGCSLFVILERFVADLTKHRFAGRLAPVLFLLSGGLGFLWFVSDVLNGRNGLWDTLWALPRDYTIGESFRWGNPLVVLFMTQRSLVLGMPLTILVLGWLWRVFRSDRVEDETDDRPALDTLFSGFPFSRFPLSAFALGLLAGTLPLIHLHSLVVLFIVTACLFAFSPRRWREWVAFGIGTALVALPELAWSMSGSATDAGKFFDWHLGWDKREDSISWFWLKNTGLIIPAVVAGLYLLWQRGGNTPEQRTDEQISTAHARALLLFYVPFALIFVVSNVAKLAPWEWDNIKILIYWFVGSLPLIALALVWLWQRNTATRVAAVFCLMTLIGAGTLDVWRVVSGQIKYRVFETDAVRLAEQLKQKTDSKALFLNAPTYNSAVVLSGRRSLMRYSGHLSSHGIDYLPREHDVKRIYEGGGVADMLLKNYNIDYVLVSPEERNTLKANEDAFRKYPVIAEAGQYRVYKVR